MTMTMTVKHARATLTGAGVDLNAAGGTTRSDVFVVCGSQARHLRDAIETILLDHTRTSSETIVAAAMLHRQAHDAEDPRALPVIVSAPPPARHHNLFIAYERLGPPDEQGFITSTGRFVDRTEALAIALASGQPMINGSGRHTDMLFSEDLW
jgi:hypothetical protein